MNAAGELAFLARGKRSIVYRVLNSDAVVKTPHPTTKACNHLAIEARFLEILNRHGIGPKLISYREGELKMAYVPGERIDRFLARADRNTCEAVLQKVISQLAVMDRLGINKAELNHPYKHIIVRPDLTPVLIDFERCRHTERPQNINQFREYLKRTGYGHLLPSSPA